MRPVFFALVILAAVFLGACSSGGVSPPPEVMMLEDYWPHEDGNFWSYRETRHVKYYDMPDDIEDFTGPIFETVEEVPPVPELDTLWEAFCNYRQPGWPYRWEGSYRLEFDGEIEYPYQGDIYQILTGNLEWDEAPLPREPGPRAWRPHFESGFRDERVDGSPAFLMDLYWRATEDSIFGWTVTTENVHWKWLESDCSVGHEFEFHVWGPTHVRARVVDIGNYWSGSEMIRDVIEVFYVLDAGIMGIATIYDPEPYAYCHPLYLGVVRFAPGIGPVYCHERSWINTADIEMEGNEDIELVLQSSSRFR